MVGYFSPSLTSFFVGNFRPSLAYFIGAFKFEFYGFPKLCLFVDELLTFLEWPTPDLADLAPLLSVIAPLVPFCALGTLLDYIGLKLWSNSTVGIVTFFYPNPWWVVAPPRLAELTELILEEEAPILELATFDEFVTGAVS